MSLLNKLLSTGVLMCSFAATSNAEPRYTRFEIDLYVAKFSCETIETKKSREITHIFQGPYVGNSRYYSKFHLHPRCPDRLVESVFERDFNTDGVVDFRRKVSVSGNDEMRTETTGDFNLDGKQDYFETFIKKSDGSSHRTEFVDRDFDGFYETVNETQVVVEAKK